MAGTVVVYETQIKGTEQVVAGVKKIEGATVTAGAKASSALGGKAGTKAGLANAVNETSSRVTALTSNLDVFGNKATKEFSDATSKALGLANIVGQGGALGFALAGAAAGVSLLALAFQKTVTQIKETERFIASVSDASAAWEKQRIAQLQREGRALTKLDAIQEQVHGERLRRDAELFKSRQTRLRKEFDEAEKAVEDAKLLQELANRTARETDDIAANKALSAAIAKRKDAQDSLKLLDLQIKDANAQADAAFERAKTIREKIAEEERLKNAKASAAKRKQLREQQAKEEEARAFKLLTGFDTKAEFDAFVKTLDSEAKARADRLKALEKEIADGAEDLKIKRLTGFETKAEFEAFVRSLEAEEKKVTDERNRQAVSTDKAAAAEDRKRAAQEKAINTASRAALANQAATATTTALSANNLVLAQTYQALIPIQERFLLLNRTTAEQELEQLKNRKEVIASLASLAQATLASIALQAQGRALQESAESVSAAASGLVRLAFGDSAGGSALLSASAQHAVAATLFGALSGGAAVGAVGIGALRGRGGLIGLSREERDQLNPLSPETAGGVGGGGGGAGGVDVGRGVGADRDSGVTRVVINNFPGSVFTADENRAAKSISRAQRRVRRDGFLQRAGG